jgi:hypothetical protein
MDFVAPAVPTAAPVPRYSSWLNLLLCGASAQARLATMQARPIARETATLSRLREKRNSRVRGTSSALEVAIE